MQRLEYYIQELSGGEQYLDKWQRLSINEKIVLIALAGKVQGFYSHGFEEFCKKYEINVTRGQLQHALKKLLQQLDIIQTPDNVYEINEVSLKKWVLDNIVTGFSIINVDINYIKVNLYNINQAKIYESQSKNLTRDILNDNFNELMAANQDQFTEKRSPTGKIRFITPDETISNFFIELKQNQREWF